MTQGQTASAQGVVRPLCQSTKSRPHPTHLNPLPAWVEGRGMGCDRTPRGTALDTMSLTERPRRPGDRGGTAATGGDGSWGATAGARMAGGGAMRAPGPVASLPSPGSSSSAKRQHKQAGMVLNQGSTVTVCRGGLGCSWQGRGGWAREGGLPAVDKTRRRGWAHPPLFLFSSPMRVCKGR